MASDAIRVDAGSGLSESTDAIAAALPSEWEGNERPYGTIAQSFAIRDVELVVRGDVATAAYWIDVHGGARWEFNGQRVGFDVYRRAGTTWELLFHTGADAQPPGAAAQLDLPHMEFVYPAADLERVAAFYQPLLGEPDDRSSQRLSYDLGDARFHFDTATLGGGRRADRGIPERVRGVRRLGSRRRSRSTSIGRGRRRTADRRRSLRCLGSGSGRQRGRVARARSCGGSGCHTVSVVGSRPGPAGRDPRGDRELLECLADDGCRDAGRAAVVGRTRALRDELERDRRLRRRRGAPGSSGRELERLRHRPGRRRARGKPRPSGRPVPVGPRAGQLRVPDVGRCDLSCRRGRRGDTAARARAGRVDDSLVAVHSDGRRRRRPRPVPRLHRLPGPARTPCGTLLHRHNTSRLPVSRRLVSRLVDPQQRCSGSIAPNHGARSCCARVEPTAT